MATETRIVKTDEDRERLVKLLTVRAAPFSIAIKDGVHRTNNQNRLQRKWMIEAAEQLQDETAEQKRGYCKLHFGVPILRNEDEDFCREYDEVIKPLPYEQKLRLMQVPFDFGVTSLMTTKQKKQYLDAVGDHFRSQGVILTEPDLQGYEQNE